ncbi:MAG: phage tail tape measure protein [Mariniphaga sp.]
MSASTDRRISFYINGKEITNDLKSIRAEMTRLVNEQARMTIGTQEYVKHAKNIKELKGILAEHNRQVAAVSNSWSLAKVGDQFNRYFSMIQAGAAAIVGLVLGFKALVKVYNDFEERVGNLSALTGLTGQNLNWLASKAKELSVSTLESGIVVTQSAQEIVDAFTKVGSARPELLKNKEALVDVTKEAIILSNAAKIKLQPAIEGLTMVMNQYNAPADQARRIINVLGAGAKEGAGEIPYLTTGFEKAGITAKLAGLSIETLAATLETLAPRFSQPEIAGRGLRGMLLRLQTGADDTNPAIVGMARALENLAKKGLPADKMLEMFGLENISVAQTLITNVSELKNYEKAISGTTVALEQAGINTSNNNARLAQAGNRINNIANELGKKLTPAMHTVTGYFGAFLRGLIVLVDVFGTYGRVIVTTTIAIIGYIVAIKLQTLWQNRANQAALIQIITQKGLAAASGIAFLASQLWSASLMVVTGNIKGATQAMRVLTATMKLNPFGLIVSAIVAAGSALHYFITKKKEAAKASGDANSLMKAEKDMLAGYSAELIKERNNLNAMVNLILRTNESEALRGDLIKRLKELYPSFLGFMDDEKISNQELIDLMKDANSQYQEKIRLAALGAKSQALNNASVKLEERKLELEDELLEIERQRYRIGDKKSDEKIAKLNAEYENLNLTLSGYSKKQEEILVQSNKIKEEAAKNNSVEGIEKQLSAEFKARDIYSEKRALAQKNDNAKEAEYYDDQIKLTDDKIQILISKKMRLWNGNFQESVPVTTDGDENRATRDLIKLKEQELERAKAMPGTTLVELTARNKKVEAIEKEIGKLNDLGKAHSDLADKEEKIADRNDKKEMEKLQNLNNAQIALINENHLKGLSTDEQYKAQLVAQELSFLQSKLQKFKSGSKYYEEAVKEFNTKLVDENENFKQKMLDADNTLSQAKIDNIKTKIDKEIALENLKWKNEEAHLRKQLLVRAELKTEEQAFNDKINGTIAEKTKEHNRVIENLNTASLLQGQMDKALILEAEARTDEQRWAAEDDKARVQFDLDMAEAEGNEAKKAQAERKYIDVSTKIKEEQLEKEYDQKERRLKNISDLTGAMIDAVGIETDLGKALYLFQQGLAIATIWTEYGKQLALISTWALTMGPIAGPIWEATQVSKATTNAVIATALVAGQTIGTLVKENDKKKKSKGYSEGGFTSGNDTAKIAGVVHEGEYVIPAEGVNNKKLIPFINAFENARKNKTLATLDLNRSFTDSMSHRMSLKQSHGTSEQHQNVENILIPNQNNFELVKAVNELNRQLKQGIKANAYINKFGRNGLNDSIEEIARFKGKVFRK